MIGEVSHEVEVNVEANKAWELYSTYRLADLVRRKLPNLLQNLELLQGDGGVGTVYKLTFPSGTGVSSYTERFTKIDNENRVKEANVFEGGFLNMEFTSFKIRFEVIEKSDKLCVIRSTYEYDVKEEFASNVSLVNIEPLALTAEAAKAFLEDRE